MKYVTFFTEGYYEKVYEKYLKPSCEKFCVPIITYKMENLKDWTQNTRLKAKMLLSCLEEHKQDIVYIDADAELFRFPSLFSTIEKQYDMALHYFDWFRHWRGVLDNPMREVYNAVMFLRNNDKIKTLMKEWIDENSRTTCYEQKVLEKLLLAHPEIKVLDLPVEYACVADRDGNVPDYVRSPIIFQNQVSRLIRADKSLLQQ